MNSELLSNSAFESVRLSTGSFILSIFLSFILSYLLSKVYKSQSHTLSNPETLARIFPLLSVATTIVIAVVKSSLALSLGLVGALSIVRFRTPIKEPEELTYIFICIAIGLATGADQYLAAVISLLLVSLFAYLYNVKKPRNSYQNLVRISINGIDVSELNLLIELIKNNTTKINFKNLTISNNKNKQSSAISLSIQPDKFEDLNNLANVISNQFPSSSMTIVENNLI